MTRKSWHLVFQKCPLHTDGFLELQPLLHLAPHRHTHTLTSLLQHLKAFMSQSRITTLYMSMGNLPENTTVLLNTLSVTMFKSILSVSS